MAENFFYSDKEREIVREDLLADDARKWALKFISRDQEKPLSSAQLRRFYNDVKALEARIETQGFDRIKPLIKMLKSKVAYACPRNPRDRKVPESFKVFIDKMVDNIDDNLDFKAFSLSFEAVVGFFYGEGGR